MRYFKLNEHVFVIIFTWQALIVSDLFSQQKYEGIPQHCLIFGNAGKTQVGQNGITANRKQRRLLERPRRRDFRGSVSHRETSRVTQRLWRKQLTTS